MVQEELLGYTAVLPEKPVQLHGGGRGEIHHGQATCRKTSRVCNSDAARNLSYGYCPGDKSSRCPGDERE